MRRILHLSIAFLTFFQFAAFSQTTITPFEQNDKWGLQDHEGKIIVKPKFTAVESIKNPQTGNTEFFKATGDYELCIFSLSGKKLLCGYELYEEWIGGYLSLRRYGIKNAEEHALIGSGGRQVFPWAKGEYSVDKTNTYVLLRTVRKETDEGPMYNYYLSDSLGNKINATPYSFMDFPANGRIRVNKGGVGDCSDVNKGKWGYLNLKGELVVPIKFAYAKNFQEGVAAVFAGQYRDGEAIGKWTLIDSAGKTVLDSKYDLDINFTTSNNHYLFKTKSVNPASEEESYGLADRNGKQLLETNFAFITDFKAGMSIVGTPSGKYGVIGTFGNFIVDTSYTKIDFFMPVEGNYSLVYLKVQKHNKTGLLKPDGELALPIEYAEIENFRCLDNTVKASRDSAMGVISLATKNWLLQPQFKKILYSCNEMFFVFRNKNVIGLADYQGKILVQISDTLEFGSEILYGGNPSMYLEQNVIPVTQYKRGTFKSGVVDTSGKSILPAVYSKIYVIFSSKPLLSVETKEGDLMVFDASGKLINDKVYDRVYSAEGDSQQLFKFEKSGKSGWVDLNGAEHFD